MKAELKEYSDDEVMDFINDVSKLVRIGLLVYDPGYVLMKVDPIAFNCCRNDDMPEVWVCGECGDEYDTEEEAEECCTEE